MNAFVKSLLATILFMGVACVGFKFLLFPHLNKKQLEFQDYEAAKTVKISKVADSTIYFDMREITESKRSERFTIELAAHTKGQSVILGIVAIPPAKPCPDGYLVTFDK